MPAARPRKAATAKAKPANTADKAKRPKSPAKRAPSERRAPAGGAEPEAPRPPVVLTPHAVESPPLAVPARQTVQAPSQPRAQARPFDPATGDWVASPPPPVAVETGEAAPAGEAPDAPKKGPGYILWSILLWADLALLALNALAAIASGAVLYFSPDSAAADEIRDRLQGGGRSVLVINTVASLVAFGLIPVLWLLGTRRMPLEGTRRFLHLHEPGKAILRGIVLTIPLLLGVAALVSVYTLATEGVEGLTNPDEEANPAVQEILDNLTWPIAVLVAVAAGVGEEIFFRGLLQRYLGVWGQALLFGLAHATGGYLPQVLFALGLGILFGHLIRRGWSLWSLIVAHTLYDFTLLAMAMLAPEAF